MGMADPPEGKDKSDRLSPPNRIRVSAQTGVVGQRPREKRPTWAYFHAAHLARQAAVGGVPGGPIATLCPDPGTMPETPELCEKIAGKVVKRVEQKDAQR